MPESWLVFTKRDFKNTTEPSCRYTRINNGRIGIKACGGWRINIEKGRLFKEKEGLWCNLVALLQPHHRGSKVEAGWEGSLAKKRSMVRAGLFGE
ncbi:hypothetical protein AAG906_035706 [Vitis piasezkii]